MNLRLSLSLLSAALCVTGGAVLAAESAPKPGAAKAEKEKKSGQASAMESLNLKKLDERSKADLKEALEQLKKVDQRYQATEREGKRLDNGVLKELKDVKSPEEAKEKLEKLKEGLSEKEKAVVEDVKKTTKKAVDDLGEEAKKEIAEAKKKAAEKNAATKTTPRQAPSDPVRKPVATFDRVPPAPAPKVPAAEDLTKGKKIIKQDEFIRADEIIVPGNRDPKNPDRILPESDVRTRTYYLKGNVQVRMENFAQDSDECTIVLPPGSSGLTGGLPGGDAKPAKAGKRDPIQNHAAPDEDGPPVESMIAVGNVKTIRRDAAGKIQTGAGGVMTYDGKTGNIVIKDWPEAQDASSVVIAHRQDAQIIMNKRKSMIATGCHVKTIEEGKGKATKLSSAANNGPTLPPRPAAAPPR